MRTHAEIVRAAGTAEEVAAKCGVSVHTVNSWAHRDSIPADMWPQFVTEPANASLDELAAGVRPRRRPEQAAAA